MQLLRSMFGWLANRKSRRQAKRLANGLRRPWRRQLAVEQLEDRALLTVVPGTVSGAGTIYHGQDSLAVNVTALVVGGVPSYSGQLTFVDSKAGDTFQAAAITSVQITPTGSSVGQTGPVSTGYFTITGLASLNGSASANYNFSLTGSLPVPSNPGSTGGMSFQATGPNGFSYTAPGTGWDAGETIALTVTSPQLLQTTTSLSSSAPTAVVGQSVTYTASVSASGSSTTIGGTVTFLVDGAAAYTATLSNGKAAYSTSSLALGTHTVVAQFNGSSIAATSQNSLTETITQGASSTYLSVSGNLTANQALTLTAAVSAVSPSTGKPSGSVTFYDGSTQLGTATINGSYATLSLANGLTGGAHKLTAVYGGDANYTTSTSAGTNVNVSLISSSTALTASSQAVTIGQSVTFTATVSGPTSTSLKLPGTPTGTVTFYDGSVVLGTATLNNGAASWTGSLSTPGYQAIQAVYSGSAYYATSSASRGEEVATPTSISLTPSTTTPVFGQSVTYTANITSSAGAPGGQVSFSIDGGAAILATVTNGKASFSTSALSVGDHTIVANFNGTSTFAASQTSIVETVSKDATTLNLGVSGTIAYGQAVTLSTYVVAASPGNGKPTGSVTFYDNGTALGTVNLGTSSNASLTLSGGLSIGAHQLTVSYSGDGSFAASTSAAVSKTVQPIGSYVSISASSSMTVVGNAVTFTATVTGPKSITLPGAPTGTVTFYDGTTKIGTASVGSDGTAQLSAVFSAAGGHTVIATYNGDTNFASSSASVTEAVYATKISTSVNVSTPASLIAAGSSETCTVTLNSGATGTVTIKDGSTVIATAQVVHGVATFTFTPATSGTHYLSASYSGDNIFAAATGSLSVSVNKPVASTITGQGSILNGQDSISVNVTTTVNNGVPSYSGSVSYTDTKAGISLSNVSITSVAFVNSGATSSSFSTSGYFTIVGTATVNGAQYTFYINISLPYPNNPGSTGGMGITLVAANGSTAYSTPWQGWMPGETMKVALG